jgi:hypothetical protein
LIGRRHGKDIVQEGRFPDGTPIRWTFSDISENSCRWRGERLEPDGKTWRLQVEFRATRMVVQSRTWQNSPLCFLRLPCEPVGAFQIREVHAEAPPKVLNCGAREVLSQSDKSITKLLKKSFTHVVGR